MGVFSFLDCVNPEYNFKIYGNDDGYLLIPKEIVPVIHKFLNACAPMYEYYKGDRTLWGMYDGYGRFGGVAAYEFLAFCNLYKASAAEKERYIALLNQNDPVLSIEEYSGLASYEKQYLKEDGVSDEEIEKMEQERKASRYHAALNRRRWQEEIIRSFNPGAEDICDLGITLFHDVGNDNLKYPLKITHCNDVCYEDVSTYSESDPEQGY